MQQQQQMMAKMVGQQLMDLVVVLMAVLVVLICLMRTVPPWSSFCSRSTPSCGDSTLMMTMVMRVMTCRMDMQQQHTAKLWAWEGPAAIKHRQRSDHHHN